ncbi:hypothetical protein RRG08_015735 [Elysia crispata]|uniref:Uncharacterized protein n=1 Tax=Elysia crispata TaxID=231223 RepID=A0AAE0YRZ4_9GAST|nr:hypothetical protein RRG08_015735 [Elysia crispata]
MQVVMSPSGVFVARIQAFQVSQLGTCPGQSAQLGETWRYSRAYPAPQHAMPSQRQRPGDRGCGIPGRTWG